MGKKSSNGMIFLFYSWRNKLLMAKNKHSITAQKKNFFLILYIEYYINKCLE